MFDRNERGCNVFYIHMAFYLGFSEGLRVGVLRNLIRFFYILAFFDL
jgi:hypothetical protein